MKLRRYFYFGLHLLFLSGLGYAFENFMRTPRINLMERRLWAYENWIILSFYALFVWLTLMDQNNFYKRKQRLKYRWEGFKQKLSVNLVLLVFPWGLFLILAPQDLLELLHLGPIYWRILGVCSLLGAVVYYFPYRFYHHRFTFYILIFGMVDNLLTGLIVTVLFALREIPLLAWSAAPLLFYFAWFFGEHSQHYRELRKAKAE